MEKENIRRWQVRSLKNRVAAQLMLDGVSFRYSESDGIVFTAPAAYVRRLRFVLVTCHGCRSEPVICEI